MGNVPKRDRPTQWLVIMLCGGEVRVTQTTAYIVSQAAEQALQSQEEDGYNTDDALILFIGKGRIGENQLAELHAYLKEHADEPEAVDEVTNP